MKILFGAMLIFAASFNCNADQSSQIENPKNSDKRQRMVRIGTAQPRSRIIDWRLEPSQALAAVDKSLGELVQLVHRAGTAGCDILALPEDTLGLLQWELGNKANMKEVLPATVEQMLKRLGEAAAAHRMYLICCNDTIEPDGSYYNTAFFIGRDGREIGRYHKVQPTVAESDRRRGESFPIFETPDLGGVGLLICYDMVMPESTRCLALAGADIIFVPTLGGAITAGDPNDSGDDLNRAAFRTRAADNFVYLVVAKRNDGSMIVSPQGKVLAEGKNPEDIVVANINPFSERGGGDAMNFQVDMRARLFRERNPVAYGLLTDPNPPVLKKIPRTITVDEAVRLWEKLTTVGPDQFEQAENLMKSGKKQEAIQAFEKLRMEFPNSWIDRAANQRLMEIRVGKPHS